MAPALRPLPANTPRHSNRPQRRSSIRVESYCEDSPASDDLDGSESESAEDPAHPQSRKRRTIRRPITHPSNQHIETAPPDWLTASATNAVQSRITRSSSSSKKRSFMRQTSRKAIGAPPRKSKPDMDQAAVSGAPPSTELMTDFPWHRFPYHILLDILLRAAPMGYGISVLVTWKSARWLLGVSRLCRALFEPAMVALYYSPPTTSLDRLEKLRILLEKDQDNLLTDYRAKVKDIELDGQMYNIEMPSLCKLLDVTPQLKHLRLHDHHDQPNRRTIPVHSQLLACWSSSMERSQIRLHSWEWSGRIPFAELKTIYMRPVFQSLRSLRFFRTWPLRDGQISHNKNDPLPISPQIGILTLEAAYSLSALSHLEHLELKDCVLTENFLSSIPTDLRSLSIIHCKNVSSEDLGSYLVDHGKNLEVLRLMHSEVDMTFTVGLRSSCPRLQVFILDLNFTPCLCMQLQYPPKVQKLLHPGQIPEWPSGLQVLKLERLRRWDMATAEVVFNSLTDAAPRLKHLRTLVITAILKIDWRDRAQFRKEWVEKLRHTFLRNPTPPGTKSGIISVQHSEQMTEMPVREKTRPSPSPPHDGCPTRKSRRLASLKEEEDARNGSSSNGTMSRHPGVDQESDVAAGEGEGVCNVVRIRIDNLRPADAFSSIRNLSNDDESADEDWDGEDLEMAEGHAW